MVYQVFVVKPSFAPAAHAFLTAAFHLLHENRVLPASAQLRQLEHFLDYDGSAIESLPAYQALHAEILSTYGNGDLDDFTVSLYLSYFLEACISECTYAGAYDPGGDAVGKVVTELHDVLSGSAAYVLARRVSHLTTTDEQPVTIGDIEVVPHTGSPRQLLQKAIPRAGNEWHCHRPQNYGPPVSLVVVREPVDPADQHTDRGLRKKLDRFLLAVVLATGATVRSQYEFTGTDHAVTHIPASFRQLATDHHIPTARRIAKLTGSETVAYAALNELLDNPSVRREGMVRSSLAAALDRFTRLDSSVDPFDQLVDLATVLEGALLGGDKGEGITLRLASRASALLATEGDPAPEIYNDVRELYGLRSTIVHGADLTKTGFLKKLRTISTVTEVDESGILVALDHAVDRLRDITRRALLARLCLATQPNNAGSGEPPSPPWPIAGRTAVDATLSGDSSRIAWRAHWHDHLSSRDLARAIQQAVPPDYALAPSSKLKASPAAQELLTAPQLG